MLVSVVKQHKSALSCMYVCVCVYPLSLLSLPRCFYPTPLSYHRAPGWAPCVTWQLPLASYLIFDSIYMSMLLSQFVPPSSSLAVPTSLFSMSGSPFFSYNLVHQYYFSRFHIFVLI